MRRRSLLLLTVPLLGLAGIAVAGLVPALAAGGPVRTTTLEVPYTEYDWWLTSWQDNQVLCQVVVEHEGLPSIPEVSNSCGPDLAARWQKTPDCPQEGQSVSGCLGVYLHLVGSRSQKRVMTVALPTPSVWVTLSGCTPEPAENHCPEVPRLMLTGEEPLPNERITAIHGSVGDQPFSCRGAICEVQMQATPADGIQVTFQADSSYGDVSGQFSARVRVLPADGGGWYVDVLSPQWRGAPVESCAKVWDAFPPPGGPPDWLSTPDRLEALTSDAPYYYLAGRLIAGGVVNAEDCPGQGLELNGTANGCGYTAAQSSVNAWQDRFDAAIVQAARDTGIPAQLMKNLFAQESQFWPAALGAENEIGLGQMTDMGADTTLLWNQDFFSQFCPLVLREGLCRRGYAQLSRQDKATLRGALLMRARSDCTDCPAGVDISHVDFSVGMFAQTLLANCEQTSRIVYNVTRKSPGQVSSYEDLWRFTLTNYNAGPGCLYEAARAAVRRKDPLDWPHVAARLSPACLGAVDYVAAISHEPPPPLPTPTPTPQPSATPTG